jgi:hypothetical protein
MGGGAFPAMATSSLDPETIARMAPPLSLLAKAVNFENQTAAARGLDEPQANISRAVRLLESVFGVDLIEKNAGSKSRWSPAAMRLAEVWNSFAAKVVEFRDDRQVVRVATLEGMIPLAIQFVKAIIDSPHVAAVEVEMLELSRLEELFARGEIDVAFSCRKTNAMDSCWSKELGFQRLAPRGGTADGVQIMSIGKYLMETPESIPGKVVVSNSLGFREAFRKKYGGFDHDYPSAPRKQRDEATDFTSPVLVVTSKALSQTIRHLVEELEVDWSVVLSEVPAPSFGEKPELDGRSAGESGGPGGAGTREGLEGTRALRDLLRELLPKVLPQRAEDAVSGTELIRRLREDLGGDYTEANLRYHFSTMAKAGSPIAKVKHGQGYYLSAGLKR